MIVTLTVNPALDRTLTVASLRLGSVNRILSSAQDAGGKGINVARALKKLGGEPIVTGFLAGSQGGIVRELLKEANIACAFTELHKGQTRINSKLFDVSTGQTTDLNESGPHIVSVDIERLEGQLTNVLAKAPLLVCAGSLLPGIPEDFYARIIQHARRRNVPVVLDAEGQAFGHGLKAGPYMIKPNREEAEQFLGRRISSLAEGKAAVMEFASLGVEIVVLSLGEDGALFYRRGEPLLLGKGSADKVASTTGCGDALVAGIVYSLTSGFSWEYTVRFSTALATTTATLEGTSFPEICAVHNMIPQVVVAQL